MLANSFYPSANLGFGYGERGSSLPPRPQVIGPIFDAVRSNEPLASFDARLHEQSYIAGASDDGTSRMPPKPEGILDPYLYPMLTRNERLRLTMLWYYTRDLVSDEMVLQKLQAKVDLLKSLIGWEFAICGLVENDIFQRLATAGLPLAILPRRESTCSHTIQQPAGSVFFIPDLSNDWRFAQSPHVSQGGLRTYAGAQLRCHVDNGEEIALGSLCVASNAPDQTLTQSQLALLVEFADMLTEDIINASRRKRAKQQEQNDQLLREASANALGNLTDVTILKILSQTFQEAQISLLPIDGCSIQLPGGGPRITLPTQYMKSAAWEDNDLIDELLRTQNHQRLKATQPIRAIVSTVSDIPTNRALVVATNDMTHVFDDIDVRFVEACAMVLRSIAQERSLQDALRTRERFMRGITHQLRTPIHGILGSVDLLADEISRDSHHKEAVALASDTVSENLKMIRSSGRELMSTVNNVIKFNRWTDSASLSKATTLGDLNKLESDILDDVSLLLPEGRLDCVSVFFNNQVPTKARFVRMNMTLLRDCLQSLVLNALQNTANGSVVIAISAASDYSSIIFDVLDTGCGIKATDWLRIFDAYEKANDHSPGAGLGLTLARNIVEVLGGTVTLESSVLGSGSHFRAKFPNPNFAWPVQKTPMTLTGTVDRLPGRFAVVPSGQSSALDEHFARFLVTRGIQQSDDVADALAIVSFTSPLNTFKELLRTAARSSITISLVPAKEDLSEAREAFSEVLFFSGPFTTDRLNAVLLETANTYAARTQPTPVEQTSSFEVSIRAQPTAKSDLLPPNLAFGCSLTSHHHSVPNCLLVDDNPINLRIMCMYCSKRGYLYRTAVDGLQAIEQYKSAVKEAPITLILLDLQMPKCDGIEACREIRAFEAQENIPSASIFIVTGQDSPSDRTTSLAAGADRFFVKPLALKSLDQGIAEMSVDKT